MEANFKKQNYSKLYCLIWIVFYLFIIDISLNLIFKFPADPSQTAPNFLEQYFEYGRSVEGKLSRMLNGSKDEIANILGYGWLRDDRYKSFRKEAPADKTLIAIYGMSHAHILGRNILEIDKKFMVRDMTAPGAPPNWSLGCYEMDREEHSAQIVILGIMTDAVAYISSTTGMTSYFEMSHPYTFPRYLIENGKLEKRFPPYYTLNGFKDYIKNKKNWQDYKIWLENNDNYYKSFLFQESALDSSVIFRLLRRSYSVKIKEELTRSVYGNDGFNNDSEEVKVLNEMLKHFNRAARMKNSVPVIYIVNNEGRSDHLYQTIRPTLEENNIPFLSTHIICPPDNPKVYTGKNSHFTAEKDIELAKEMIKIIEREIKVKAGAGAATTVEAVKNSNS